MILCEIHGNGERLVRERGEGRIEREMSPERSKTFSFSSLLLSLLSFHTVKHYTAIHIPKISRVASGTKKKKEEKKTGEKGPDLTDAIILSLSPVRAPPPAMSLPQYIGLPTCHTLTPT
jgi:hypothetical protein